jgi:hypothetical protein
VGNALVTIGLFTKWNVFHYVMGALEESRRYDRVVWNLTRNATCQWSGSQTKNDVFVTRHELIPSLEDGQSISLFAL